MRGHYRRVGDKIIWIEPFEKGDGELEKRIYGTEKESDVNVIPKVFEVTRTVFDKEVSINEDAKPDVKSAITKKEKQTTNIISDTKKEPNFLQKIIKICQWIKSKFIKTKQKKQ